jgi:transmembrane sensor
MIEDLHSERHNEAADSNLKPQRMNPTGPNPVRRSTKPASGLVPIAWRLVISIGLEAILGAMTFFEHPVLPALAHIDVIRHCAPYGDHKRIKLQDNSTVELNSSSCITTDFSTGNRLVHLESGEAIFQVVRDPNRPFVVETGRVSITDVGTRFDVYAKGELGTRVAVLEGAVQILPRDTTAREHSILVTAEQEIEIPQDSTELNVLRHITARDADRLTAWVDGMILFDGQSLEDIFTEFQRYQSFTVRSTDPQLLQLKMGGSFRTTDLSPFLWGLRLMCIRAEYDKSEKTITLSRMVGKQRATCP